MLKTENKTIIYIFKGNNNSNNNCCYYYYIPLLGEIDIHRKFISISVKHSGNFVFQIHASFIKIGGKKQKSV